MLRTRAGDPPSVKTLQGLRSDAAGSLPGNEGHGTNSSQASGPGQGVSLAERRGAAELSTSELKPKLREGHNDQSMILELVRRMEEVELRSKTSSSLHSALENVHSGPQPLQQGWGGELRRDEVQGLQVRGRPDLLCCPGLMPEQPPVSTHGLPFHQVARFSPGLPSTPPLSLGPGNQVRAQSSAVSGQASAVPCQQQGFQALQAPLTAPGVSQLAMQQGYPVLQAPLTAKGVPQLEVQFQQQGLSAHQIPSTASGTVQQTSQYQQQVAPALQALPVAQVNQVQQGPQSFQGTLLWDQRHGTPGSPGFAKRCQVPVQRSSDFKAPRKVQSETLVDLDPIPITRVAGGSGLGIGATSTTNLLDILDPAATGASPFVAVPKQGERLHLWGYPCS